MHVTMPPNPEPPRSGQPGGRRDGASRGHGGRGARGRRASTACCTLPILIHGDAAFPGQGIVAETLNLSRLSGYDTDGTIHIIANNQLGFTATPAESYSTSYASGLARGFKIPIVHVNADDPVACLEAARLAWEYRARFRRDFLIDLIGYRRYGHNEGDEPAFTQPLMYKEVAAHPTVREMFAEALVAQGAIPQRIGRGAGEEALHRAREGVRSRSSPKRTSWRRSRSRRPPGIAGQDRNRRAARTAAGDQRRRCRRTRTASRSPRSSNAGASGEARLLANPTERTVDWAAAEELALATILADGIPIRLTGEDVERGTFSHRHAVFHDAETGKPVRAAAGVRAGAGVVRDSQQPAHARTAPSASSSATTSRSRRGW